MTTALEPRASHDVTDRRSTKMESAIDAARGCSADLRFLFDHPEVGLGLALLVAEKLDRLSDELEGFRARDLLSMRTIEAQS